MTKISYFSKKCSKLTEKELIDCSNLFSNHYGMWDKDHPDSRRRGNPIKLSVERYYRPLTHKENYYVALAYAENILVGHAFYLRKKIDGQYNSWVIQIVVHKNYQRQGIGKTLLYSIWGFSDDTSWGLATANPNTVKTLEAATFRKVSPVKVLGHIDLIKKIGEDVSFVIDYLVDQNDTLVNTNFFIDQTKVSEDIKKYKGEWALGELKPGYEWLAFTFQDQDLNNISEEKFNEMLAYSENLLKDAYGRMEMKGQGWTKHTTHEINYILSNIELKENANIMDFGCATGRHSLELASHGYNVLGIDFVESNIKVAISDAEGRNLRNVHFSSGDCRSFQARDRSDLIICLYDVIGSFPEEKENISIIKNMYNSLNDGGYAVISVMNMELTKHLAKYKTDIYKNPRSLIELKPSGIMQRSGNVFKPDYYIIDEKTNLVYRKEQFTGDGSISAEYVIRDKRYTADEICKLVKDVGFNVLQHSFVQLGKWNVALESTNEKAKEILLFLQK